MLLGLSSDKASKSKVSLKKSNTVQLEALEKANVFKRSYSQLGAYLQEKLPIAPNKFTSQTTKNYYAKTSSTYPMTLNCQKYLKRTLKPFG